MKIFLKIFLGLCLIGFLSILFFSLNQKMQETKKQFNNNDSLLEKNNNTTSNLNREVGAEMSLRFLIAGDTMFARGIHYKFENNLAEVFSNLNLDQNFLSGLDLFLVNLEGAISGVPVKPDLGPNNFTFIFPRESAKILNDLGVNFVSLANNHTNNNGVIGLEETKNILKEANISWAGGPYLNDFKNVGFVSGQNMDLAIIAVYAVLELDVPDIMPLIKELKTDNYKIMVFAHFGDEYQKIHNQLQENLAHLWIENGADIIVGTHPHVIQDTEVYLGKPIIYSLGNFVFDQNWSKATREGVLLSGEFTKDGLYLSALPTMAVNSKPTLIQGDEKVIILGKFYTPWAGYLTEQDSDFDFFFPN